MLHFFLDIIKVYVDKDTCSVACGVVKSEDNDPVLIIGIKMVEFGVVCQTISHLHKRRINFSFNVIDKDFFLSITNHVLSIRLADVRINLAGVKVRTQKLNRLQLVVDLQIVGEGKLGSQVVIKLVRAYFRLERSALVSLVRGLHLEGHNQKHNCLESKSFKKLYSYHL